MAAIKPPRWCKDAIPSKEGWRHPKTNELLLRRRGLLDDLVKDDAIVESVTEDLITEVITDVITDVVTEEVIAKPEVVVEIKPEVKTRKKKSS
jgi:hypothetical protein